MSNNLINSFNKRADNIIIRSLPLNGPVIRFKSFITDFGDTQTANWNSQEIYGRMDAVYTYKNTIRKINIAFDVPSYDLQDAKENLKKIDDLIDCIYPVYKTDFDLRFISAPPYVVVDFANLVDSLMGWIEGVSFKPELESGFFVEDSVYYPKLYKLNLTLNVVHDFPPSEQIENRVGASRKGKKQAAAVSQPTSTSVSEKAAQPQVASSQGNPTASSTNIAASVAGRGDKKTPSATTPPPADSSRSQKPAGTAASGKAQTTAAAPGTKKVESPKEKKDSKAPSSQAVQNAAYGWEMDQGENTVQQKSVILRLNGKRYFVVDKKTRSTIKYTEEQTQDIYKTAGTTDSVMGIVKILPRETRIGATNIIYNNVVLIPVPDDGVLPPQLTFNEKNSPRLNEEIMKQWYKNKGEASR